MRAKMEYHIISGKIIETRRCWLTSRDQLHPVRGQRKVGNTSLNKIKQNEKEAVRILARILNTNFGEGFLFVTLKYSNENLPADYEAARKNASQFLRKARAEYSKTHERAMRYICVNANWSPKRNCKARLHHHIVLDLHSIDVLAKLWPVGEFHVERVRNPSDLTRLAAYLCANTRDLEPGKKQWTSSKGLDKPIYTEPRPIEFVEAISPLPDTTVVDAQQTIAEDGIVVGSYMRSIAHDKIKIRGGMVILPRRRKKDKLPQTLDMAIWQDDD